MSSSIFRYVNDLRYILNRYNSAVDSLSEEMFVMLIKKIKVVQQKMDYGCKRFNWNSLGMVHTVLNFCVLWFVEIKIDNILIFF